VGAVGDVRKGQQLASISKKSRKAYHPKGEKPLSCERRKRRATLKRSKKHKKGIAIQRRQKSNVLRTTGKKRMTWIRRSVSVMKKCYEGY